MCCPLCCGAGGILSCPCGTGGDKEHHLQGNPHSHAGCTGRYCPSHLSTGMRVCPGGSVVSWRAKQLDFIKGIYGVRIMVVQHTLCYLIFLIDAYQWACIQTQTNTCTNVQTKTCTYNCNVLTYIYIHTKVH